MKAGIILISLTLFVSALAAEQFQATSVDFEAAAKGKMDPLIWSETYSSDSDQMLLYQVTDGIGRSKSRGLSLDTKNTRCSYRLLNKTPLVGKEYTVSAKFRIEVDTDKPAKPNHPIFGVYFNTTDKWFNGKRIDLMLLRRSNKDSPSGFYGMTSIISQGVPAGWIEPKKIGLPYKIQPVGSSATSTWFQLSLTIKQAENGLWDLFCYVLDDEGNTIEALGAKAVEFDPEFMTSESIYGGITVGWSESPEYRILKEAGLKSLYIDDFSVSSSK